MRDYKNVVDNGSSVHTYGFCLTRQTIPSEKQPNFTLITDAHVAEYVVSQNYSIGDTVFTNSFPSNSHTGYWFLSSPVHGFIWLIIPQIGKQYKRRT